MNQLQRNLAFYKDHSEKPLSTQAPVTNTIDLIIGVLVTYAPASEYAIKERNAEFGRLVVKAIDEVAARFCAIEDDEREKYRLEGLQDRESYINEDEEAGYKRGE